MGYVCRAQSHIQIKNILLICFHLTTLKYMPKTSKTAFMSNKRAIKLFFLQLHLWLITSDTFEKI